MGFRYRKSINLGGGFRVNLSTKGVGYSWGVKGYRVTKTADGRTRRTVSIPGTGISYVDEHGPSRQSVQQPVPENPLDNYSDIDTVKSADVETLRSAEYEELFKIIKRNRAIQTVILVASILSIALSPVILPFGLLAFCIFSLASRSTIEYEFDDTERQKWETLSSAWKAVAASKSLQEITLTAKSKNTRETAGIESAYDTVKMTAGGRLPSYLKTNIKPVVFTMKDRQFAIMPDRLLVFVKNKLGALEYDEVKFDITAVGFLETGPVPKDAEVVKQVWAYANNDGSPDRRYSNNKQYPVMKYGNIVITSKSGLDIRFMCSNETAADRLNELLNSKES